jgi:hypothetical protein
MEYRAVGSHEESAAAYCRACDLFIDVGRIPKAAECQKAIGNTIAAAGNNVLSPLFTCGLSKTE